MSKPQLWMRLWFLLPDMLQPRFVRISYAREFFRWLDSGHHADYNWSGKTTYTCPAFRYKAIKLFVSVYILRGRPNMAINSSRKEVRHEQR